LSSNYTYIFKSSLAASILNLLVVFVKITFADTSTSQFIYQGTVKGYTFGVDGISLWLLFLVNIVIPIVLLNGYKNKNLPKSGSKGLVLQNNYVRIIKLIGKLSNKVFIVLD
jgi:NADH:ubiquinone oxidoreductase subunit 4 (subunit M)